MIKMFSVLIMLASLPLHANSQDSSTRLMKASLWVEDVKLPITHGHVLFVDSVFSIFVPQRQLTLEDVHPQVIVQISAGSRSPVQWGAVVDYDMTHSWMLIELKKQEITAPRQKLSEVQIMELLRKSGIVPLKQEAAFLSALKKFEKNNHQRGLAGKKSFLEVLGNQMQVFGDKFTAVLTKSQRRIQWDTNVSSYLPGVDSCKQDFGFSKKIKQNSQIKITKAYHCRANMGFDREIASALAPELQISTGMMSTEEPYLRVPVVTEKLREISAFLQEEEDGSFTKQDNCVEYWVSEKNIFSKSCIKKNDTFVNLYDGYHLIGFYQNQKIVYQAYYVKGFSKKSHRDIVEKVIKETKGNVL